VAAVAVLHDVSFCFVQIDGSPVLPSCSLFFNPGCFFTICPPIIPVYDVVLGTALIIIL